MPNISEINRSNKTYLSSGYALKFELYSTKILMVYFKRLLPCSPFITRRKSVFSFFFSEKQRLRTKFDKFLSQLRTRRQRKRKVNFKTALNRSWNYATHDNIFEKVRIFKNAIFRKYWKFKQIFVITIDWNFFLPKNRRLFGILVSRNNSTRDYGVPVINIRA